MSTVTTRAIGGRDRLDAVCVKADGDFYKNKSGFLGITITAYSWTSSEVGNRDYGTLDVRVPNFNSNADTAVVDSLKMGTPTGSTTGLTKKYYFAVNNGIPSPAVRVNGDNTWDLMELFLELANDKNDESSVAMASFSGTLTYTTSWTDYTQVMGNQSPPLPSPSPLPLANKTVMSYVLNLKQGADEDVAYMGSNTIMTGWMAIVITGTTSTVVPKAVNRKTRFGRLGIETLKPAHLSIKTTPDPSSDVKERVILDHDLPLYSSTKLHQPIYQFIWALNSGKIDGNAQSVMGGVSNPTSPMYHAALAQLQRREAKDADISLTINFNHYFVSL